MRFQNLVNEGLPDVGLASSLRSAMALFYFSQPVFFFPSLYLFSGSRLYVSATASVALSGAKSRMGALAGPDHRTG